MRQPTPIPFPPRSSDWASLSAVGDLPHITADDGPSTIPAGLWGSAHRAGLPGAHRASAREQHWIDAEPGWLEIVTEWITDAPVKVLGGATVILVASLLIWAMWPWGFALPI